MDFLRSPHQGGIDKKIHFISHLQKTRHKYIVTTSTDFPITTTSIHVTPNISWGYMYIIPASHTKGSLFPSPPLPPGEQPTQITPRESMLLIPLAGNMEEEWAMGEDSIQHVSGKTGQRCLTVSLLFSVITVPWVQCGS